jgi:hypothetical protein
MKSIKNKKGLSFIIGLVGLILFFLLIDQILEIRDNKRDAQFNLMYNWEIKDKILYKSVGGNQITLELKESGIKIHCRNPRNFYLKPDNLHDFVKVYDSINKPKDSYDFYIIRDSMKYHFKLDQDINSQWR